MPLISLAVHARNIFNKKKTCKINELVALVMTNDRARGDRRQPHVKNQARLAIQYEHATTKGRSEKVNAIARILPRIGIVIV